MAAAARVGARLAEPGEFTLRAHLNGRMDLMQAEAVADLVEAVTPLQARVAFDQLQGTLTGAITRIDAALFDVIARLEASVDFPEEGYHFAEPATVVERVAALVRETDDLLAAASRGRRPLPVWARRGSRWCIAGRHPPPRSRSRPPCRCW